MMDTLKCGSYETLKQIARNEEVSRLALEELKSMFKTEISSKRREDCIRSLCDLIDVLECRDVISEYDIKAIHTIAVHCNLRELKQDADRYFLPKGFDADSFSYENQYRQQRFAEEIHNSNRASGYEQQNSGPNASMRTTSTTNTISFAGQLTDEKRKAIYKKLSKEVGSYWRRFGRELSVTEGDMDNIEAQFPRDLPSRIYKLLQYFEEDDSNDPKKHVLLLCRALDRCQRKDLRRKIEDIMSY